ncbi:hypothetical protein [uncultured Sphingomonas sp.]|uniref:hypothetical protein n=1 Tax=uncultured Sphingomonas sp. TaxID=158754 RepID=UPI0025DA792A|nr:hypothetical protein [uncultured Sphingomonas sp.]
MKRKAMLLVGALAAVAAAEVYHGPLRAAQRLEQKIERQARAELDRNEMFQVQAQLQDRPLSRTLVLSGPADDFQRGELVRVMGELPGVAAVEWDPASLQPRETRS